jgi:nicotinate-nucleotide pyrophosphorylase (carboxylating)
LPDIAPTDTEIRSFEELLRIAHREDFGSGDVTSDLLGADARTAGTFTARESLVLCGGVFLSRIAGAYGDDIRTEVTVGEGQAVSAGQEVARWRGPSREVLPAERVALNFLQRLSGIATLTRRYVEAVAHTPAKIYDTRKTTPGWRDLEKYAVRAGGGCNHRRGLYDAVLIKDNHLSAAAAAGGAEPIGAMQRALDSVRPRLGPEGFIEVEVDTLDQLAEALKLDLDVILLDNMTPGELRRAVAMRDEAVGKTVALEASGQVTLQTVAAVAETGVERVAVGAITHSATAVDIALDDRDV